MAFESLFAQYDRLVVFDTETTGLLFSRDEIIEFAAVVVEQVNGEAKVVQEYDELIALSPGGFVPPKIEQLTGISTQDLREKGLPKTRVARDIAELIRGNTLLLAYNAHLFPAAPRRSGHFKGQGQGGSAHRLQRPEALPP